jgi:hypothetical protein
MAFEITAIDGQAVGPAAALHVVIDPDSDYGLIAEDHWHQRVVIGSTHHGQTPQPRVIDLKVYPGADAFGGDYTDWVGAAIALFRPSGALHTITGDLSGTEVAIEAAFGQAVLPSGQLACVAVPAFAPSQFWRTTGALTSDTTGTATNGGNAPAAPKITIRPTTGTVVRWRVTLVDVTGRGIKDHPLRLPINTNSVGVLGADDLLLFDRGQSVPFQAISPPSATTPIFFLCSLLPNETSFVDLVIGGAVNNVVTANQLDPAGFDWAHASFTNTNWVYRGTAGTLNGLYAPSLFETARAPRRPGAWHRTEYGGRSAASVWEEQAAATAIALTDRAAITMISQIKMANAATITGLDVNVSWADSMAKQRRAGEWDYRDSESASVEETIVLTDAVQVILWPSTLGTILLDLKDAATPVPVVVALQSGEVPTISVAGSSVTMARINGTLTNSTTGDQIIFEDCYIDADATGGLIVDTNAAPGEQARVYPSLSTSPLYTASSGRGWRFTNRAGWPLVPGANTWSWSGDGAPVITVEHADAWVV